MYSDKTSENIKEEILKNIKLDTREGSFSNYIVTSVAEELADGYSQLKTIVNIMFLKDIPNEYLEKRAAEYGIYKKTGSKANGLLEIRGTLGTIVPKGSLFSTRYGIMYSTIEEATIELDKVTVRIESVDIGEKYNVLANLITEIAIDIVGVTSVNNPQNLVGGTNEETFEELLNRVILQIQKPATSGNAMHYKQWSMAVNGVGDAKVFPLHGGNGKVLVIPITSNKRSPDSHIINNVSDNIEKNRPIGAIVTVKAPTEVVININASLSIDTSYTLEYIKEIYMNKFKAYIYDSVFRLNNVDYYKCLSIFYEIPGVLEVTNFKMNDGTSNIKIEQEEIQVAGTVTIV